MGNHPNRRSGYSRYREAVAPIVEAIALKRRVGWSVIRLHIEQETGRRALARIGWRASNLGLEPDTVLDVPKGVTAYIWEAPDDTVIDLAEPWDNDTMRTLCRAVGSKGYDRHDGQDRIAWLAHLPLKQE